MSDTRMLERKLNRLIDAEALKGFEKMNSGFVFECSEALLKTDKPENYRLTKAEYNKAIDRIIGEIKNRKTVSRKKIVAILVAAALAVIMAVSVVASGLQRLEFVQSTDNFSAVLKKPKDGVRISDITVGFIPSEFKMTKESCKTYLAHKEYMCGEKWILISKASLYDNVSVDDTHGEPVKIEIDGIEYSVFGSENDYFLIMWMKNSVLYDVSGNIDRETLLKIALSVN